MFILDCIIVQYYLYSQRKKFGGNESKCEEEFWKRTLTMNSKLENEGDLNPCEKNLEVDAEVGGAY